MRFPLPSATRMLGLLTGALVFLATHQVDAARMVSAPSGAIKVGVPAKAAAPAPLVVQGTDDDGSGLDTFVVRWTNAAGQAFLPQNYSVAVGQTLSLSDYPYGDGEVLCLRSGAPSATQILDTAQHAAGADLPASGVDRDNLCRRHRHHRRFSECQPDCHDQRRHQRRFGRNGAAGRDQRHAERCGGINPSVTSARSRTGWHSSVAPLQSLPRPSACRAGNGRGGRPVGCSRRIGCVASGSAAPQLTLSPPTLPAATAGSSTMSPSAPTAAPHRTPSASRPAGACRRADVVIERQAVGDAGRTGRLELYRCRLR